MSRRRVRNIYFDQEDDDYDSTEEEDEQTKKQLTGGRKKNVIKKKSQAPPSVSDRRTKVTIAPGASSKSSVTTSAPPPKGYSPIGNNEIAGCPVKVAEIAAAITVRADNIRYSGKIPKTGSTYTPPPPPALTTTTSAELYKAKATEDDFLDAPPPSSEMQPVMHLVVIGHVDSGKSTLMGQLLLGLGEVSVAEVTRHKKEAGPMGKTSFVYAWILDQGQDERERGVTIDVCVRHLNTGRTRLTILDAPGHKDFVPNMLRGAVLADAALLVIDSAKIDSSITASGLRKGGDGQTKEHLQLVRALGIRHLIVVINKMDMIHWNQAEYNLVLQQVAYFLYSPRGGFQRENVRFIPASGLCGTNLLKRLGQKREVSLDEPAIRKNGKAIEQENHHSDDAEVDWWIGGTVTDVVDEMATFVTSTRMKTKLSEDRGVAFCVAVVCDILSFTGNSLCSVSLKVVLGELRSADKLMLYPGRYPISCKTVTGFGLEGDYIDATKLDGVIDPTWIDVGSVLVKGKKVQVANNELSPYQPDLDITQSCLLSVCHSFRVQLLVLDTNEAIVPGMQVVLHVHVHVSPATVTQIEGVLKNKNKTKCKVLSRGMLADVIFTVPSEVCLMLKRRGGVLSRDDADISLLSRIIVRYGGASIAAGIATS